MYQTVVKLVYSNLVDTLLNYVSNVKYSVGTQGTLYMGSYKSVSLLNIFFILIVSNIVFDLLNLV